MFRKHYYGNARFLGRRALRPYLRADQGVALGHSKYGVLIDPEPNHTLLFAPTRSGKGVSFVIPNALHWNGSLLVLDVKGEAYQATAGFRSRYQPVYVWGPTLAGHRWNVLDELRHSDTLYDDALRLATVLVPEQTSGDNFWNLAARNVLAPALSFLAVHDDDTDLASVYELLPVFDAFVDYVTGRSELPSYITAPLQSFAARDPKLRTSILATLESRLGPWMSPATRTSTGHSDFRLSQFFREPCTIYLWAQPGDFDSHKLVLTLFCQAVLMAATRGEAGGNASTLLLLDEFPLLGDMPLLTSAIAYLAGYNVRVALVAQDTTQLPKDASNQILANTRSKIFFKPVDPHTPKYLSELSGQRTLRVETKSRSKQGTSRSESYQPRPLLRPDEIAALPEDQALYFLKEGLHRGRRIPFFDDPLCTPRLLDPPPLPAASEATGEPPPSMQRLLAHLRTTTDSDAAPEPTPRRKRARPERGLAAPPDVDIDALLAMSEDDALQRLEAFLTHNPETATGLLTEAEKEATPNDPASTARRDFESDDSDSPGDPAASARPSDESPGEGTDPGSH